MPVPTAPWDRVFSDIKIAVPGAVDAVVQQELYRVSIDFFDQTNMWTEEIPIAVDPGTLTYPVTPTGKGQLCRLLLLYDPAMASPDKRWVQGMVTYQPENIILAHAPSSATTWNAIFSKEPLDPPTAENYPDIDASFMWILQAYRDAFVTGTLANLYMQPAKPYSNLQLGRMNNQNYISQRSRARVDVLHSYTYNGQRWQFPQAYATTHRKGWT